MFLGVFLISQESSISTNSFFLLNSLSVFFQLTPGSAGVFGSLCFFFFSFLFYFSIFQPAFTHSLAKFASIFALSISPLVLIHFLNFDAFERFPLSPQPFPHCPWPWGISRLDSGPSSAHPNPLNTLQSPPIGQSDPRSALTQCLTSYFSSCFLFDDLFYSLRRVF